MAEGFARARDATGRVEVWSAGSRPSGTVNARAIRLMAEKGIDLSAHVSKSLESVPQNVVWDWVVTMGCGDACPHVPARRRLDWDLPDPKSFEDAGFRAVRDRIEQLAGDLVSEALAPVRES